MAAKRKATAEQAPQAALTLEGLLTSPMGFALTGATPVQRAICRIVDGRPLDDLVDHPRVIAAVGGPEAAALLNAPAGRPRKVYNISGIRGAKSLTLAAIAVSASQRIRLAHLGAGEVPRFSILSTSLDIAQVSFNDHLVGKIMASPVLKALMLDEPKSDSILLRHPSGRPVEIKVVAGSRAGSTLVARWSAGLAADEAPRMYGDEAVVNFEDSVRAVEGRILDGAQIFAWGSPWAPQGPVYDTVVARFGQPGPDLVVIRAPAYDLNPIKWTLEECERMRRDNPDAYRTDVEAEFADADAAMYASVEVERAVRQGLLEVPYRAGRAYVAAMDPATRGNAWTVVVGHQEQGKLIIDAARQWKGSKADPLNPRKTLAEIAALLRGYELDTADTDQLGYDFIAALAEDVGLVLNLVSWSASSKVEAFDALRRRLGTGSIELPPDPYVRADLVAVRRRVTLGGVQIHLPSTGDGRHTDYAPPLARLAVQNLDDVAKRPMEDAWEQRQQKEIAARERRVREREQEQRW